MRLYLPATLAETPSGDASLSARPAHAVTPGLRAALPDADEEELEFVAQLAAADDSLVLLAATPVAPRLRVVVAADVDDAVVRPATHQDAVVSAVTCTVPVALAAAACLLVDEPAAAADIAAALAGDAVAGERVAEHDLLWYDVGELAHVPVP